MGALFSALAIHSYMDRILTDPASNSIAQLVHWRVLLGVVSAAIGVLLFFATTSVCAIGPFCEDSSLSTESGAALAWPGIGRMPLLCTASSPRKYHTTFERADGRGERSSPEPVADAPSRHRNQCVQFETSARNDRRRRSRPDHSRSTRRAADMAADRDRQRASIMPRS